MRSIRLLPIVVCLLWPAAAKAQFAQYTPPGGPDRPAEPRQEALKQAVEEARWHLKGLRLDPWLGIRDVSYVDDGRGDAQLTGSAGAGVRAYLPTGPAVTWAAHVLPEYSWFGTSSDRNRLNGRYGLAAFGYWNRLTLELTASREEAQGITLSEFQQPVNSRSEVFSLAGEVVVVGSLSLFVSGRETRFETLLESAEIEDPELPPLEDLNRDESVYRAGIRFRTRRGWAVGLGAERSEVDFSGTVADRSNAGTAPILELVIPGRGFYLGADLAYRSLEPEGDAQFVPYEDVTGTLQIITARGGRLEPTLYARRELVYSVEDPTTYFEEDRAGVRLGAALGWRVSVQAFAEIGDNSYAAAAGEPVRTDDVVAYGLTIDLELLRGASLVLGAGREDFDSNVAGLDRTIDRFIASITFGGGASPWY